MLADEQEEELRDLESLEHEVDIANQRMKLELLKKKLAELGTDAGATTQAGINDYFTGRISNFGKWGFNRVRQSLETGNPRAVLSEMFL